MKTLLFALTVLLVSACGRGTVDPAFSDYVTRFEQASQDHGKPTKVNNSISFGDLGNASETGSGEAESNETVAVCHNGFLQAHDIIVDKNAWTGMTDTDREEVIFHELGHCVLGRGHTNETQWNLTAGYKVATSVMNVERVNVSAYEASRDSYVDELFNGKNENE